MRKTWARARGRRYTACPRLRFVRVYAPTRWNKRTPRPRWRRSGPSWASPTRHRQRRSSATVPPTGTVRWIWRRSRPTTTRPGAATCNDVRGRGVAIIVGVCAAVCRPVVVPLALCTMPPFLGRGAAAGPWRLPVCPPLPLPSVRLLHLAAAQPLKRTGAGGRRPPCGPCFFGLFITAPLAQLWHGRGTGGTVT